MRRYELRERKKKKKTFDVDTVSGRSVTLVISLSLSFFKHIYLKDGNCGNFCDSQILYIQVLQSMVKGVCVYVCVWVCMCIRCTLNRIQNKPKLTLVKALAPILSSYLWIESCSGVRNVFSHSPWYIKATTLKVTHTKPHLSYWKTRWRKTLPGLAGTNTLLYIDH